MAKILRRAIVSPSSSHSSLNLNADAATATPATDNSITKTKTKSKPLVKSITSKIVDSNYTNAPFVDPLRSNDVSAAAAHPQYTAHVRNAKPTQSSANDHLPYTAEPTFIDSASIPPQFKQNLTSADILAAERARIRQEFFATYDVMTGVRIAATLGGFFGLMVFLIVWKSRSSSNETMKVLKDPKMAAVAAVCMQEEEEREIQEAMVATGMSIYPDEYDTILYRRQRMLSLGNVSAPPLLNHGYRFSSVGGGYSSLLEPPRRFSYSAASGDGGSLASVRRKSGSQSSRIFSNYAMGSSFGTDDYFIESEDELENEEYDKRIKCLEKEEPIHHHRADSTKSKHGFLEVPLMGQDSRRSSAMTCCSTDSSYLERRSSAFTLGVSNLPASLQRKCSTASHASSTCNWDYYYPDIQVIEPTPKPSPCPSERSIYDQLQNQDALEMSAMADTTSETLNRATTSSRTVKNTPATNKDPLPANNFIRKHSIAYCDPESTQAGRKQQIHSISADTVDVYPYNQADGASAKPIHSTLPTSIHKGFHLTDSPTDELRLSVRRKIAVVEMPKCMQNVDQLMSPPISSAICENNNTFPYTNSAAALPNASFANVNSSSISIDSTPVSLDKLNGSVSLGTVSAKALFNADRRAPLASLSSFKISSLEYQDSELRSLDEDSVFVDSVADTDEDMQQYSSDSEEASLGIPDTVLPVDVVENISKIAIQKPIEKCFSLTNAYAQSGCAQTQVRGMRICHPLLQRHRTISASSSDRVSLIGQQLQEFHGSVSQSPTRSPIQGTVPLETHFGAIISTNSPPFHQRRTQLLQQLSDPHSLPTTTTTTATTDDACSTLNTELGGIAVRDMSGSGTVTTGSASHTQHSSLTTVVSIGQATSLEDDNNYSSSFIPDAATAAVDAASAHTLNYTNTKTISSISYSPTLTTPKQLPPSRLNDEPCASSISDSFVNRRQQTIISMPESLKNLILAGKDRTTSFFPTMQSKSATNLYLMEPRDNDVENDAVACRTHSTTIMVELPLIKLPTTESSESSSASADFERSSRSKSDESRDPSLPGSSRKWSKETLF